jgi:small-conductance mechanosensitive channel
MTRTVGKARRAVAFVFATVGVCALGSNLARAQLPSLPGGPASAPPAKAASATAKTSQSSLSPGSKTTVATTGDKINVRERVSDSEIQRILEELLPQYLGVRSVTVSVHDGVVTLNGRVDDDDTHDEITQFVQKVEGVRLILNRLRTDDEVMTAPDLAWRELAELARFVVRKWLLVLVAIAIVLIAALIARLFNRYSETILAPFVRNVLLRSIVGSFVAAAIVIGGVVMALGVLRLTHAVLSVLGLAGVVGLAVGFAFKDITENFIASVLLGVRRPFRVGDYIQVAGNAGVVQSLNTRATVLVTLDGKHVRIPNAVMFKEVMVNSSASPTARATLEVLIPYEACTANAMESMSRVLKDQEGLLENPAPRVLVVGLEGAGVRLRAIYWAPAQGIDGDKLASDLFLKVKVALQQLGITPSPTQVGAIAVAVQRTDGRHGQSAAARSAASIVASREAEANLARDANACVVANDADDDRPSAIENALQQPESHVSEEGVNLLETAQSTNNGQG